jgi:hypothetical protein
MTCVMPAPVQNVPRCETKTTRAEPFVDKSKLYLQKNQRFGPLENTLFPSNGNKDARAASIGLSESTTWPNGETLIAAVRTSTAPGEERPFLIRIDDGFMKHSHGLHVKAVQHAECLPDVDDQRIGVGRPSASGLQTTMGQTFAAAFR